MDTENQVSDLKEQKPKQRVLETQREKLCVTFCLCVSFFSMGLVTAVPGPTLLDLQAQTHTDTRQISSVFTGRGLGTLAGAVLGGVLSDRLNPYLQLFCTLLGEAICTSLVPWSWSLPLLLTMFFIQGVAIGAFVTVGNFLCLNIWTDKNGPYLQCLHFAFGFGTFLAPLFAELFLSQRSSCLAHVHLSNSMTLPNNVSFWHHTDQVMGEEVAPSGGFHTPLKASTSNIGQDNTKIAKVFNVDGESNTDRIRDVLFDEVVNITSHIRNKRYIREGKSRVGSAFSTTVNSEAEIHSKKRDIVHIRHSNTLYEERQGMKGKQHLMNHSELCKESARIDIFRKVQYVYLSIAIFFLISTFLFFCLFCTSGKIIKTSYDTRQDLSVCHNKMHRFQFLFLLFLFYLFYTGVQNSYAGLVMTFAVKCLGWSESEGTLLTLTFWGAFALKRGLGIGLSNCLGPSLMLTFDMAASTLALVVLVATIQYLPTTLWICTALIGVGMATVFASGITWAQNHMHLTGMEMMIFKAGASIGEMAIPALTGFLLDIKDPMWFIYSNLGFCILTVGMYILVRIRNAKLYKSTRNTDKEEDSDKE